MFEFPSPEDRNSLDRNPLTRNRLARNPLARNPEYAAQMATNAVFHFLRGCGLTNQRQVNAWVAKVFASVTEQIENVN